MSTQLLNGRFFNRLAGVSLAACAIAIAAPSLRADDVTADQTLIASFIPAPKTINTATAPALATAVAEAITQTTGSSGFTPAGIAASALEPYPFGSGTAKVRGDRNAATGSAADVAAAAVNVLVTNADVTFDADAAAITDSLVAVNAGDSAQDLNAAGQGAVIKSVLETISTDAVTNSALLGADETIGNALATDVYLEGLPGGQLTTVLQGAIAGITGVKAKAPAEAPEAAEDFVQGLLLSGAVPDSATYSTFAVAILKDVAKNTSVDELVSYQVGLAQAAAAPGSVQANLVTIGTALFTKYSADAVKITQGLTAALPAVNTTEANRVLFVGDLTVAESKVATSIAEGATFTDPYFSSEFVGTVLGAVSTAAPTKLSGDATTIATGVGEILGQDGAELTQVAEVYSELTGSGVLSVASAATFAKDLIGGAIKGLPATTPTGVFATVGDGGLLMNVVSKHPVATATTLTDLEGIEDLMAVGIVDANTKINNGPISTKTEATKLAGELGALAKDIALFVKGQSVNGTLVGESLAGTLAQYVSTLGLNTTVGTGKVAYNTQSLILAAIQSGIDAANPTKADKLLIADALAAAGTGAYMIFGAVDVTETAVTDL